MPTKHCTVVGCDKTLGPKNTTGLCQKHVAVMQSKTRTKIRACSRCAGKVSRYSTTGLCRACDLDSRGPIHHSRPITTTVSGNSAQVEGETKQRIKTLADLIRVCEIDESVWRVTRHVINKWEVGAVLGPKGQKKIVTEPLWQVKAWMERKIEVISARQEIESLKAQTREAWPKLKMPAFVRSAKHADSPYMLEIQIPDLHVGKMAWSEETGWTDYDHKIAEQAFDNALDALLARTAGYQFSSILFVTGNDLFHSDTKQGTTFSGTPLDTDSRYPKMFETGRRLTVRGIQKCRQLAPIVRVPIIPGNHDQLSTWHLGNSLEMFFKDEPSIEINNKPRFRKYYQHGKVMIMLTHGNKGKLTDYPNVMAREEPEMFGSSRFWEAHTGDKHQTKTLELHGVKVRIFPALCAPDAWHAEHQFVGAQRAATALVWHAEEGEVGSATYTIPDGRTV